MTHFSFSDWMALSTLVVTVVGILLIWSQTKKMAVQLTLQHFADYTKRYQEIILHFPEDVNTADLPPKDHDDYNNTMRHMRAYADLCYEEWHLNQRGLINKGTWAVWSRGIETAFSKPAFQQAWIIIRADTHYGTEFVTFIEQCMNSKSARTK